MPDVHAFDGHIACAGSTQSEIVVPLVDRARGATVAVLDVDSNLPAAFNAGDAAGLERICASLEGRRWESHWP